MRSLRARAEEADERPPSRGSTTRREALALAAAGAASAAFAGRAMAAPAPGPGTPRVVVVGGGLAGLTAALPAQAGRHHRAASTRASDRLGGRCWTRGAFADGQVAEHGGELIDTGPHPIRQLAQSLGLTLDNLLEAEQNGTEPFYYFDGAPYTVRRRRPTTCKAIWQKLHTDLSAASYPTLYNSTRARPRARPDVDRRLDRRVASPAALGSRLGQLLDVAYNIEYGAESSEQSSLNLLYLLGFSGQGQLRIFGQSNEKYHVRGGNDQITTRSRDALRGADHDRAAARSRSRAQPDGTYTLTFPGGTTRR